MELKLRFFLSKVDFRPKILISDALSTCCACFPIVLDNRLRLLLTSSLFGRSFTTEIFNIKDTHRADPFKFLSLFTNDRFIKSNVW